MVSCKFSGAVPGISKRGRAPHYIKKYLNFGQSRRVGGYPDSRPPPPPLNPCQLNVVIIFPHQHVTMSKQGLPRPKTGRVAPYKSSELSGETTDRRTPETSPGTERPTEGRPSPYETANIASRAVYWSVELINIALSYDTKLM